MKKVKIVERYGSTGETFSSEEEITTEEQLNAILSSVVRASQAWFNDIPIVVNGYILDSVYNGKQDLLRRLNE